MSDSRTLRNWGALFTVVVMAIMLVVPLSRPAHASAITIKGQNPENGGPGNVISDKDSSTDTVYHFVARITDTDIDVPGHIPSGNVQVRIDDQDADANANRTLFMTRVGTTDTWEAFWDEGADYPTVILAGGGTVTFFAQDAQGNTSFDTEPVTLAPAPTALPIPDPRETVEITSPANGAQFGFFNGQAVIQGTVSEGTTSTDTVNLYYTTAAANAEPAWTLCGTGAITDNASGLDTFQGTCNAAADAPNVTVVGARVVAAGTTGQDSGDAHRINAFTQQLTTVSIVPAQASGSVGRCSTFTVQTRGQSGAPISGLNVDVHMTGASAGDTQDNLQFATNAPVEGFASDPYLSPTASHNSVQPAAGCDQAGPAFPPTSEPDGLPDDADDDDVSDGTPVLGEPGTQANHPVAGAPDTKHIEGTTDANGNWRFSIDAEQTGIVNLRVWVDSNDDDVEQVGSESVTTTQHTFGPFTPPPPTVDANPKTDTNPIGTTHTITATVGQSGAPVNGQAVQFRVTAGPHADNDLDNTASTPPGVFGPCVTNAAGQCSDSYTGVESGTDTIQVWIDTNGNFVLDTGESASPNGVTKTWTAAAETVAASPQTATNNVGQTHTINATVTQGGIPQSGRVVQFRVTVGPHFDNDLDSNPNTPGGVFGPCTTGANGQCTDSYVGVEAGDDSRIDVWLDADGDFTVDTGEAAEPGGVEKQWNALPITVEASPATATNQVGQSHNVTATVREGGNLAANKTVTFKVTSGPHAGDDLDSSATTPAGVFGQCSTAANGQCSKAYTGTKTGQDQITVFIDGDADFVPDTGEPSTQVTKTWTSVPVTAIDCVPETDTNQVNTSHTVTATVTGSGGTPVAGATVAFQVRVGPHSDNDLDSNGSTPLGFFGSGTTDGSGHVSKSYTGTETVGNGGNDVIDCWVDANANNQDDGDNMEPDGSDADTIVQANEQTDSGELSDYVDKTWTVAPPPPPQQKCPGASSVPGNHIVGTAGNDTLTGTSGPDVICGLGGNDSINGLGSDDLILGGDGADTIRGGDGDDLIFGQAGNDVIYGNSGDDRISGGSENDRIDGGDDDDRIWGVGGNDTIYGGFGNDRIVGNAGDDRLVGGPGLDTGYGLAGADRLFFRDGIRDFRVDGGTGVDACSRDPSDPVDECP